MILNFNFDSVSSYLGQNMSKLMMNEYMKILERKLLNIVVQKSGFWGDAFKQ